MSHEPDASPINPLPPVIWILALPMIAMEAVLALGSAGFVGGSEAIGWRLVALSDYGVPPLLVRWMAETGQFPAEHLLRFVAYSFVHTSLMHALFALVFLLAIGNMVARVFRPWAVVALFFGSAIAGAVVFSVAVSGQHLLVGGYPAVYGLIGAYTFLLWVNLVHTGGPQMQAFTLIGFLMGIQLLWSLLFGPQPDWVADLTGFVTGFALSFVVSPGGWARMRAKLRHK